MAKENVDRDLEKSCGLGLNYTGEEVIGYGVQPHSWGSGFCGQRGLGESRA
tara:strand:+ start:466 stop:618 length:153 start_codon:yes stop_codon:yes gene_type:complete